MLGDVQRKDSLSLNLEYVNLNISRTRRLEVRVDKSAPEKANIVRFSSMLSRDAIIITILFRLQFGISLLELVLKLQNVPLYFLYFHWVTTWSHCLCEVL